MASPTPSGPSVSEEGETVPTVRAVRDAFNTRALRKARVLESAPAPAREVVRRARPRHALAAGRPEAAGRRPRRRSDSDGSEETGSESLSLAPAHRGQEE